MIDTEPTQIKALLALLKPVEDSSAGPRLEAGFGMQLACLVAHILEFPETGRPQLDLLQSDPHWKRTPTLYS